VASTANIEYWSAVTRATGGFVAPALPGFVVPALDQVGTMLRARYLITFPTPARLPTPVSVRVDTGHATLTADTVVTAATGDNSGHRSRSAFPGRDAVLLLTIVLGMFALLGGAALVAQIRRSRA
jgi:hypothetical protein